MKDLMGDGTPYYRYTLEAGVKKIIEQIDSGLIDLYKDYTPEYLDEFWTRRDLSTEYATLRTSAYTFYAGDTVIFKKSFYSGKKGYLRIPIRRYQTYL